MARIDAGVVRVHALLPRSTVRWLPPRYECYESLVLFVLAESLYEKRTAERPIDTIVLRLSVVLLRSDSVVCIYHTVFVRLQRPSP